VLLGAWLGAIALGALLFALADWPATERTCWTFLLVEAAACGWLALADVRAARTS
jgi:hypothetical protein